MLEPIGIKKSRQIQLAIEKEIDLSGSLNWWQLLQIDFKVIFDRDPAARHWLEAIFCYPGWQAIILHRIARRLWLQKIPLFPLLISHLGRFLTGIEIHPGAKIGKGVFIDHGMGVTIGETAVIGDFCMLYQDVTLGGTGKKHCKRHPTLGNNVTVGAGSKILGNIRIGDRAVVGAAAVVLTDVPSDCTVVGNPARIVKNNNDSICILESDLQGRSIEALIKRVAKIEKRLQQFEKDKKIKNN